MIALKETARVRKAKESELTTTDGSRHQVILAKAQATLATLNDLPVKPGWVIKLFTCPLQSNYGELKQLTYLMPEFESREDLKEWRLATAADEANFSEGTGTVTHPDTIFEVLAWIDASNATLENEVGTDWSRLLLGK